MCMTYNNVYVQCVCVCIYIYIDIIVYIHSIVYIYIYIAYATYDSAPQMNWTVMMGLSTAIWHVALSFSYWDEVGYSDDYHTTTAHFNSRIERISPGTHGISTIRCRQSKVRTSLNGLVWMKRTIRAVASKVKKPVSRAAGPQISLSHCVKQESSRIFLALNMFTQQISVSSTDMADSTEVSDGQTRPHDHSC